jgi:apoptosis-inducing factor 2
MQVSTRAEAEKQLALYAKLIKDAQNIVIVGGGAVGCELSGEILDLYPTKKVILLNGQAHLLAGNNATSFTRERLRAKLEAAGVKVVLNDRVMAGLNPKPGCAHIEGEHVVNTNSGKKLKSDLTFLCTGSGAPNSGFLSPELLTEKKEVKVLDTLQVDNAEYHHVFSLGDVAATGATKWTMPIRAQGKVVADNIHLLVTKSTKPLQKFVVTPDSIVAVTISSKAAVAQIPYVPYVMSDFMIKSMKCKDLLLSMIVPQFGQPAPK